MAEEGAKPAKKSKMVLLLVPVVLANMGGLGYMFLRQSKAATPAEGAAEEGHGEAKGEHGEGKEGKGGAKGHDGKAGPVVAMDPFVANLNEAELTRYIKMKIDVELTTEKAKEDFEVAKFAIRDAVLRYLSNLKFAETQGEAGNTRIRKEVLARMNKELGEKKVKRVFISEFVVQ